jgi:aspartyl-tRNA(Asn)/glutamyl-tRNA(Gln) amidotransferase subunit B
MEDTIQENKTYFTTIGLEIHAELNTRSKMFCGCKNDPEEKTPNTNICPVCTAQPGSLPAINKKAVESVVRVGLAIGANLNDEFSEFDRKNYFYPDIPKAYQISQYKFPIVFGGELAGVKITRIHLEEDTATSKHDQDPTKSLVDFNRAGVPLMELVTEPVIHEPSEVGKFAKELQLILRYLGVSDANMEKGQMRVEVNVSISPDPDNFGVPVEVKNINSFKAAESAAKYEIARMTNLWNEGRQSEIIKETRGWDENKNATFSQRNKEVAEEYRYFPDPDLPKLVLKELFDIPELRKNLPELPEQKRLRYETAYGIKPDDVEIFVTDLNLEKYFETVAKLLNEDRAKIQLASNYIISDLLGLQKKDSNFVFPKEEQFVELIELLTKNEISSRTAKDLLPEMHAFTKSIKEVAEERGLIQKNDPEALKAMGQKVLDGNEKVVTEYKSGKESVIMFLVGQFMKESKGSANPQMAKEILEGLLKN